MKKMMTITAIASIILMTGCNTMKGVGQDVSKAGSKVSQAAEHTEEKIKQH